MKATEWEKVLLSATGSVRREILPLAQRGSRARTIGTGASGDKTIYADKVAEDELLKVLGKVAGVRILSEEAGMIGDTGARTLAVIDPLDGSSNFERGLPFYCTSVGIVEVSSGEVIVGVVRDLRTGDVYSAQKGKGATKNGKPIRTSGTSDLSNAVVGVDVSSPPPGLVADLVPLFEGVKRQVHLGANALEICYLAEGKIDAFVDFRGRIRVTDFAAANLIAHEAGAKITDSEGEELVPAFDLEHRFSFVASANEVIHGRILGLCGSEARRGASS